MKKIPEIVEAKWLDRYSVQVTFNDLRKGVVDLEKYLSRGIFKELKNIEKFKRLKVNAELGTIAWPNGADIAPEVLYREAVSGKFSSRLPKAA